MCAMMSTRFSTINMYINNCDFLIRQKARITKASKSKTDFSLNYIDFFASPRACKNSIIIESCYQAPNSKARRAFIHCVNLNLAHKKGTHPICNSSFCVPHSYPLDPKDKKTCPKTTITPISPLTTPTGTYSNQLKKKQRNTQFVCCVTNYTRWRFVFTIHQETTVSATAMNSIGSTRQPWSMTSASCSSTCGGPATSCSKWHFGSRKRSTTGTERPLVPARIYNFLTDLERKKDTYFTPTDLERAGLLFYACVLWNLNLKNFIQEWEQFVSLLTTDF